MICRLIDLARVTMQLLMFKVYGNFGNSKIEILIFLEVKGLREEPTQILP